MGYRALVSLEILEEIIFYGEFCQKSWVWKRSRHSDHGGAVRFVFRKFLIVFRWFFRSVFETKIQRSSSPKMREYHQPSRSTKKSNGLPLSKTFLRNEKNFNFGIIWLLYWFFRVSGISHSRLKFIFSSERGGKGGLFGEISVLSEDINKENSPWQKYNWSFTAIYLFFT